MKKIINLALLCVLIFASVGSVFAEGANYANSIEFSDKTNNNFLALNEKELAPYFDYAKKVVEVYNLTSMSNISYIEKIISSDEIIRNIDEKATSDLLFDLQLTNEVNDILKSKLEYETYPMYQFGYTKKYIEGTYEILNWKVIDDNFLWCEIASKVTYQYSDANVISGFSEVIQVVIENPANPRIVDFYNDSPGSFDTQIRSHELDLIDPQNWLSNQNINEIRSNRNRILEIHKEVMVRQKNMMNEISELDMNSQEENIKYSDIITLSTSRSNAVSYALANYNKATPSSGGQSVSFYNFNPGCTEFISHSLLAGGFRQVSGGHLQENGWYFTNVNNRSSSWAGVNPLFGFLSWSGNTGSGPKAQSFIANTNNLIYPYNGPLPYNEPAPTMIQSTIVPTMIRSGNIIQIKYNSSGSYAYPNYGHSVLITGFAFHGHNYDLITPLATWRTSSNSNGVNRRVIERYPPAPNTISGSGGHLYRVINLNY